MENESSSMSFVVISGISFPHRSRKYLVNLVKEIVERHKAKFVIVAGHTIAGKEVEQELKQRVLLLNEAMKGKKMPEKISAKELLVKEFVHEKAAAFNEFLPKLNDVSYHIQIAEKILDRPIGTSILEEFAKNFRNGASGDIRLYSDPEAKMTLHLSGFGEMRILVPRKAPWFSENITGLSQRLVNSFLSKTFSLKPRLILVGGTGTGSYLPRYGPGIPVISVPALNKIEEQLSTENMVGCVVVTVTKQDSGFQIIPKFYDFRTAVFNEKALALPADLSRCHKDVLTALMPGSGSLNTLEFRLNQDEKRKWKTEKVKKIVEGLKKRKIVTYNEKGNRYSIVSSLIDKATISLEEFEKDKKTITTVDESCCHAGALKVMYYTLLREVPRLGIDADAIIDNGDLTQGISHNYEYNGELLPIMNSPDKHEALAALMKADHIMKIFHARWKRIKGEKLKTLELIDACLIEYGYKYGNHDEPRFSHSKEGKPLGYFDVILRKEVLSRIVDVLVGSKHNDVTPKEIEEMVNRRIIRIGESRVMNVKSFTIGVKHPYQARTHAKGMRIKQTADFFARSLTDWPDFEEQNISMVKVANFHEAATVFASISGRTVCGVMTGAQVYDTMFEANQNKVVDYGIARTIVDLNKQGQILSASIEYTDYIAPEDKKILFADTLTLEVVSDLCLRLAKMFNMDWR